MARRLKDDLIDAAGRDADGLGEAVLADAHGQKELFGEDLTGVNRFEGMFASGHIRPQWCPQSRHRRPRLGATRSKFAIGH